MTDMRNRGKMDRPIQEEFERLYSLTNNLRSTVLTDGEMRDPSGASDAWSVPLFDANTFIANGAMTWTVQVADVSMLAYHLVGKTMTVALTLLNTTVAGTPNTELRMLIPAARVAKRIAVNPVLLLDNSARTTGYAYVGANESVIRFSRTDLANFTASSNATSIYGQITFEVV